MGVRALLVQPQGLEQCVVWLVHGPVSQVKGAVPFPTHGEWCTLSPEPHKNLAFAGCGGAHL